ncbi:MAG: nucleotidyltransferase [Candidatus Omnitrophota bacterium]|nr:nucleotidyltransferase [Candidatus Omnitrophota bacterium]
MNVKRDYEELLGLLNKNRVKYCVVGAYALAFYKRPRYTNDIDILVEPDIKNADKVIKTLNEFGFRSLKLSSKDFSRPGRIVQLGYEPLRVDILTSIEGCSFTGIWKNKKRGKYGNEKIYFIGIKELIKNKKASNRKQDQADLEILKRIS